MADNRNALVAKAARFLSSADPMVARTPVASRLAFLRTKGLTETEILEALNQASGGALVASALGQPVPEAAKAVQRRERSRDRVRRPRRKRRRRRKD